MSFVNGLISALGLGELWNSQTHSPKVYLERRRVHHYEAGVFLFLLGEVIKSPTLAGFGADYFSTILMMFHHEHLIFF